MEDLARLGLLVTCSIAIYVGARTLAIWRRTRMVPELMIGLSVLGLAIGCVVLTVMDDRPIVAHRLWLWGMGTVTQVIVLGCEVASWYATENVLTSTPMGLHLTSALGLAGITSTALAFFPPNAYVRFVTGSLIAEGSRA